MAPRSGAPDPSVSTPSIGYFSMEIAVDDRLPTYSGGLGVLAGDHLRAAADLGLPVVAVTLLYRGGYFVQHLDAGGSQIEEAARWEPRDHLEPLGERVEVTIEGRPVRIGAWRLLLRGVRGHVVPIYFLDTDLEENEPGDRAITDRLYGGDLTYRLKQEAVLGLGGVALLTERGHDRIRVFHMNEGHSALLTLALPRTPSEEAVGGERETTGGGPRCVFTTHTPVPAGHDRFPRELVAAVLGPSLLGSLDELGGMDGDELNMTLLGMSRADFVNAVSFRHSQVSRSMFPRFPIQWITNGVHAGTWVSPAIGRLLDETVPGWRGDNALLRAAVEIDPGKLRAAHHETKRALFDEVGRRTGRYLDPAVLTIAVARRAATYKRTDLFLSDPDRLRALVKRSGPLQVIYSGKAHPADREGKSLIERVVAIGQEIADAVTVIYLEEYSMGLAGLLCAGADVWLNTPVKPLEASGTSGMKAALNGVPSLSVLDGWWIEGNVEGVTGWAIGDERQERDDLAEVNDLYDKLETVVAPLFYEHPDRFAEVMRGAIALNGSYFNAERMVAQYAQLAYRSGTTGAPEGETGPGQVLVHAGGEDQP